MPFLYEGRQHKRTKRESLDCAMALEELVRMGVSNIITFDAHDPRVQNAIPLSGFDNFMPTYQFVKALFEHDPGLRIDKEHLMIISPDEGAMHRAVYLANNLSVDMGMFYKRRDYSRVVGGRNPIVAHEFLGSSVKDKTVLIIDDMISSGESMLDTARELKERRAGKVIVCCTFGLFTNGLEKFDEFYEKGYIDYVITTNPELPPQRTAGTGLVSGSRYEQVPGRHYQLLQPRRFHKFYSVSHQKDPGSGAQTAVRWVRIFSDHSVSRAVLGTQAQKRRQIAPLLAMAL